MLMVIIKEIIVPEFLKMKLFMFKIYLTDMASQTTSKNINLSCSFQNYIQTIYNNDSIETFDKIKQIQDFIREEKIMITLAERQLSEFQDIEDTKNILNSSLSQIFTYMSKNKNNISITELDFINQNSHTITMTIKETFKNNNVVQLEEKEEKEDEEDEDDACTSLDLSECYIITDADLIHISNLTNLTSLDLRYCANITDAGLIHLSNLTNLTSLNLYRCDKITDAGLVHLSNLTNLTSLNLRYCANITDAGLIHLSNLTKLKEL